MKQHAIRVIVASEYPEVRAFLKRMVEIEDKTVIVGEAENGTRALALARNLRPDVAVIDSYLPYAVGLDDVSLSRVGGLDAAQTIAEDVPNVQVILLSSFAERVLSDSTWRPDANAFLCKEMDHSCVPFTLGELRAVGEPKGTLVFANVEMNEEKEETEQQRDPDSLSDRAVFYGAMVAGAGWLIVLTIAFANIGIFVVLAGLLIVLLGFGGKLVARVFGKRRRSPNDLRGRAEGG